MSPRLQDTSLFGRCRLCCGLFFRAALTPVPGVGQVCDTCWRKVKGLPPRPRPADAEEDLS